MKIKSMLTLAAVMLFTAGFAAAQAGDVGRCGQPRGTCGNECDGSGFMNQGRGNGKGEGQGFRRGPRDGKGKGAGDRQRRRDGSGPGCNQGT